jgi:DNA-binding MarR family transcriptional regulator
MSKKNSENGPALLATMGDEFRQLSTATILFHQAIADRLGMHVTDHKCAELLTRTGPIPAGELAQLTGLTTGAITGVIDRLEKAGFVRRAKDPNDRRRVVVELIPEHVERVMAPLFESVSQTMTNLCATYSTQELAVIRDFIARFRQCAWDETKKLREGAAEPTHKPPRSQTGRRRFSRRSSK